MAQRPVVLVVGGGYVGLYTALRLQKRLSRGRAEIVVVDPQPHMTYQPFLPEAAAGSVEPRHVVVPLRRTLPRCRVVTGAVVWRSEEHTSELQSRQYLVCRLLLEKQKIAGTYEC